MISDEKKALLQEQNELNLLIQRGTTFEIEKVDYIRPKGLFSVFKKKIRKVEKLKYIIQEPTLAVLDRISAEQIELAIDENVMISAEGMNEARRMPRVHARRMAGIVALAVLGQDYIASKDEKSLRDLTEIFYKNIKPSRLMQLVLMINTMTNLGDFTNSIRLMSGSRTTVPIRIEEENKKD